MAPSTIFIADPIHAGGILRLRERYRVVEFNPLWTAAERAEILATAEAIVLRTFRVDEATLELMPRLRLIAKHGSGVDNIDIAAASRRHVLVANTPGGANASAVAEGAVTLMLAVLRRVRDMDELVRDGRYSDRWRIALGELGGRTLGLVGFGRIAQATAKICRSGFDMKILAYDPYLSEGEIGAHGAVKIDSLLNLAALADIVSVHVPLDAATHHLVDAGVLAAMKPGAIFINTARGGTVDEAALADALSDGRIGGAGLDVFEQEPPDIDNALLQLPNVVLSPHVAGVTETSLRDMAIAVARVIENVFDRRRPETLLNGELWEEM